MSLDYQILMFIQDHFLNPVFDVIMPFFSAIGTLGAVWIITAIIMICFKKSRAFGIMILIVLTVSAVIGELGIKHIVGRIRPCNVYSDIPMIVSKPLSYSFPSGHTSSSFAAATILFCYNKKIGIAGFALAATIAFSRMYLFVHYPTDVLAGLLLGIFVATITYYIYKKKIKKATLTGGDTI